MIDGVPLYETKREALLWAKQYGLTGNHVHFFNGIRGYMGGKTHIEITAALQSGPTTTLSAVESGSSNFITDDKLVKLYQDLTQLDIVDVVEQPLVVTPTVAPTVTPIVTTTITAAPTSTNNSGGGGY